MTERMPISDEDLAVFKARLSSHDVLASEIEEGIKDALSRAAQMLQSPEELPMGIRMALASLITSRRFEIRGPKRRASAREAIYEEIASALWQGFYDQGQAKIGPNGKVSYKKGRQELISSPSEYALTMTPDAFAQITGEHLSGQTLRKWRAR